MRQMFGALARVLAFSSVSVFNARADWNCLEDYSVYSLESSDLRDRSQILYGSMGSNIYSELGVDAHLFGSLKSVGNATLRDRAIVEGNAEVGGALTRYNQTRVNGSVTQNTSQESCPITEKSGIAIGSADITVANGQSVTLVPGNYRDLQAYAQAKIYVRKGVYNFRKFQTEPDVKVILLENTGTEINVLENLFFSDRVSVSFSGASNPLGLKIYTHQQIPLRIGVDLKYIGTLTAPRSEVSIATHAQIVGRVFGKKITVEPDVFACTPPKVLGIRHSEGAYGPIFDPTQMEYKAAISNSVSQVDLGVDFERSGDALKVNGSTNTSVNIPGDSLRVDLTITRPAVPGFPPGCFESHYFLTFKKNPNPIVRVKEGAPCTGANCDGTTWDKAFKDIQSGLIAAQSSGKEIWLAEGTYKPSARRDAADPRSVTFQLGSGSELHGGFKGLSSENLETRLGLIPACVLSGDLLGNDDATFPGDLQKISENAYHTVSLKGRGAGILIDRITVARGAATGASLADKKGAGIAVDGASPVIRELVLTKNYASQKGGALYANGSKDLQLFNSYCVENQSLAEGGGISLEAAVGTFGNLVFAKNSAISGGALALRNSSPLLKFLSVSANSANFGGGMFAAGTSQPMVDQSIFWGNAAQNGPGISKEAAAMPNISYSDVQGAFIGGAWNVSIGLNGGGNMDLNPVFIQSPPNAFGADGKAFTQDDGLQISKTSPVIDKGQSGIPAAYAFDLFGINRPSDGDRNGTEIADMGAYEYFEIAAGDVSVGYYVAKSKSFFPVTDFKVAELLDNSAATIGIAANSSAGYTIKLLAAKNKHLKDSFYGYVRTLKDDAIFSQGIQVTFFRVGEEGGKLVYASRRSDGTSFVDGKALVFVSQKSLETAFNPGAYLLHAPVSQGTMKVLVDVPHSQF